MAETDPRGLKRSASGPAEDVERGPPLAPFSSIAEVPGGQPQQAPPQLPEESRQPPEGPSASSTTSTARAPFEALVLDNEQLESLSGDSWSHPLLQVKHKLIRRFRLDNLEYDPWHVGWALESDVRARLEAS